MNAPEPADEELESEDASEHGRAELEKLAQRRAGGEISKYDFDLNFVGSLNDNDVPLRRSDVGNQAVVLDNESFETLGSITFIHAVHGEMTIEPESLKTGDSLVIYPEELGND